MLCIHTHGNSLQLQHLVGGAAVGVSRHERERERACGQRAVYCDCDMRGNSNNSK